jgi:hypothetical protein
MEIEKQDRLKQSEIHDKRLVGIAGASQISPTQSGGTKMAENSDVSQGFAESMDRAQSAGRKMSATTSGMFENWSDMYGTFFSLNGTRRIAEVYIETGEKIANEFLDYGRKVVELSAGGVRKFWHAADELRRETRQSR